jgi:hypothetical protein
MSKTRKEKRLQWRQTLQNKHFSPLFLSLKTPVFGLSNLVWLQFAMGKDLRVGFVTFVHGSLYEAMARLPPLRLKFLVLAETVDQPSSSMVSAVVWGSSSVFSLFLHELPPLAGTSRVIC